MYTMKQTCEATQIPYETLKFYCNEGLIPNVKRGENNYRLFDDNNVAWIKSLSCLKNCGMKLSEMKEYLALCLAGESTIPERKIMLDGLQENLYKQKKEIQENIDYIDWKQNFYDGVLSGDVEYYSNLVPSKK